MSSSNDHIIILAGPGVGLEDSSGTAGSSLKMKQDLVNSARGPALLLRSLHGDRDYLLDAFADSLCGAFFCSTRTRCCPDSGIETLPPSTISRAVTLRP
jgi:hypothetical protein